jgi:hypothetical protein
MHVVRSIRFIPWLFACIGAGGLFVGFYGGGQWRTGMLPDSEALAIPQDALTIGNAWADPDLTCVVPLANQSRHAINITKIAASCECTSIGDFSKVMAAGSSQPLRLNLDLTKSINSRFAVALTAYFSVDGGEFSKTWDLTAEVKDLSYQVGPDTIRLTGTWPPSEEVISQDVTVALPFDIASVEATCTPAIADVAIIRSGESRGALTAQLSAKSTLDIGIHAGMLSLYPVFDGELRTEAFINRPKIALPVIVTVLPNVRTLPDRLRLGRLPIGHRCEEIAELVAADGVPFSVTACTVNPGSMQDTVTVSEASPFDDDGAAYRLVISATRPGAQTVDIEFTIQEVGRKQTYVSRLSVQYYGVDERGAVHQ